MKQLLTASRESALVTVVIALLTFSYFPNIPVGQSQLTLSLVAYGLIGAFGISRISSVKNAVWLSLVLVYFFLLPVLLVRELEVMLLAGLFVPAVFATQIKINISQFKIVTLVLARIGVALSLLAILQLFLNALGLRAGLNDAYDSSVFGFARPRLFFEEPQFLASFLLLAYASMLTRKSSYKFVGIYIVTVGILVTMSRGAAAAILVGTSAYVALPVNRFNMVGIRQLLATLGIALFSVLSFIGISGYIVSSGKVQPAEHSERYLRHMLGLSVVSYAENLEVKQTGNNVQPTGTNTAQSNELPATSVNNRWVGVEIAIDNALDSPRAAVVGELRPDGANIVMTKGYGTSANGRRHIINNFYADTLAGYGMIGVIAVFGWIAVVAIKAWCMSRSQVKGSVEIYQFILVATVLGAVQLLFFSSIVNNLHYWLILSISTPFVLAKKSTVKKT